MTVPAPRNTRVARRSTAGTRAPARRVEDIDRQFHAFLYNWGVTKDGGRLRDAARDVIKKFLTAGGDADHDVTVNDIGSQQYLFPVPLEIGGRKFRGVENRCTVTTEIDLDKVDEWLETLPEKERKEIADKLYVPVTDYVFQPDELYKLNQQGVITDDALDALNSTDTNYALCVLQD